MRCAGRRVARVVLRVSVPKDVYDASAAPISRRQSSGRGPECRRRRQGVDFSLLG